MRERTARLEAAIKELEAFSYSVSHDLRSPLRAIAGFARALREDCGDKIDAEGHRLLGTIREKTRRMGQLIDDLLAFSRAGRQQLDAALIDMTGLAHSAFQNLIEATPLKKPPAFDLQPLPEASGDRAMLRQVFTNLLANALKFSSPHPAPAITVSGWSRDGFNTYCVKDNGVGFDPRFAHKLFGVFQRLHSKKEFGGTGIGLALVQRIVHRHDGKVWAESTPHGREFLFLASQSQRLIGYFLTPAQTRVIRDDRNSDKTRPAIPQLLRVNSPGARQNKYSQPYSSSDDFGKNKLNFDHAGKLC